jgi:hypothetical protein
VGTVTVKHGRTLLAQGTPELIEAVKSGAVAVSAGKDGAHLRVGAAETSIF